MSEARQISLLEPLAGEAPDPPPGSSDEFYTPRWVFDPLAAALAAGGLRLEQDTCATAESAKLARYFDVYADGLSQQWTVPWWCNCPWTKNQSARWVPKMRAARVPGAACLPVYTDRRWFQELEAARDPVWPLGLFHGTEWFERTDLVITKFTRRVQFGYPGNPEGDAAIIRSRELAGLPAPSGAKIFPVFCLFLPAGWGSYRQRVELAAAFRAFEPRWPSTTEEEE